MARRRGRGRAGSFRDRRAMGRIAHGRSADDRPGYDDAARQRHSRHRLRGTQGQNLAGRRRRADAYLPGIHRTSRRLGCVRVRDTVTARRGRVDHQRAEDLHDVRPSGRLLLPADSLAARIGGTAGPDDAAGTTGFAGHRDPGGTHDGARAHQYRVLQRCPGRRFEPSWRGPRGLRRHAGGAGSRTKCCTGLTYGLGCRRCAGVRPYTPWTRWHRVD